MSVSSTTPDEVCTPDVTTPSGPITADVTGAQVTCRISPSYTISGSVSEAADNTLLTITLSYADTANPNPADISSIDVTPSGDGTFSFTGIPENKYYFLSVVSTTADEVCTTDVTTPSGPITADVTGAQVTCTIRTTISGTVSGLANGETITLTLSPTGGVLETEGVTGDNDATAIDTFAFDTRLVNGDTYEVTTTSPAGKTCTVAPAGTQTMGDADVNITVTCILNTYSISGSVTGASSTLDIHIVLTVYDDNTGTGGTSQSLQASFDNATFSFTGIPENKYYILRSSSTAPGEMCSSDITTRTQITDNVTDALITCSRSNALFIKIWLANTSFEASQTTLNVFFSDTAVPATTGTPDKVINGSDPAVLIIPSVTISNSVGDGFYHDIGINNGQYYAITITTASGTCTPANATGGPVTASLVSIIRCQ